MNEIEFETLNDEVITRGQALSTAMDPRDPQHVGFAAVRAYADAYARQAVARAAMQQHREGRHTLAAQIMEGAR